MPASIQPDSPILVATFRGALVTETASVVLNIIMLATLTYRLFKNSKAHFSAPVVSITLGVLIFGLFFSFGQFVENFLVKDCGDAALAWITFFFYVGHRWLLFTLYLYRLKLVFRDTKYAYHPMIYLIVGVLIMLFMISGVFVYGFDYGITYVDIGWTHGVNKRTMCSWVLGNYVTYFSRTYEFVLNGILLVMFLWKLHCLRADMNEQLSKTSTTSVVGGNHSPQPSAGSGGNVTASGASQIPTSPKSPKMSRRARKHRRGNVNAKTEILFRKLTILTAVAVLSTFLVALAYSKEIKLKPFAIFFSLDACINSFCAFLMFKFNHDIISPYFGNKCDRCCCIKFLGCFDCYMVGLCGTDDSAEEQLEQENKRAQVELHVQVGASSGGSPNLKPVESGQKSPTPTSPTAASATSTGTIDEVNL